MRRTPRGGQWYAKSVSNVAGAGVGRSIRRVEADHYEAAHTV